MLAEEELNDRLNAGCEDAGPFFVRFAGFEHPRGPLYKSALEKLQRGLLPTIGPDFSGAASAVEWLREAMTEADANGFWDISARASSAIARQHLRAFALDSALVFLQTAEEKLSGKSAAWLRVDVL